LSRLARLGVLFGAALLLGSCASSQSSSVDPLSGLSLQPSDLATGFARCARLSGQYPKAADAYLSGWADGEVWRSILSAEASAAWVEIYGGSGACDRYASASEPMAAKGSLVQEIVIKYRTLSAAQKAFPAGQFVPAEPIGFMNASTTTLYGTPVRGAATGLGSESYVDSGTVGSYSFLHAAWQHGQYVATLFVENGSVDLAKQLLAVLNTRLPGASTQAPVSPANCHGVAAGGTGSISGDQLAFPGPGVPALRIYAVRIGAAGVFCSVTTVANQRSYVIGGIPAGDYNVIAYPASGMHLAGGYTRAVPCGLQASCSDHFLLPVVVHEGQSVTNIQPNDWYTTSLPPEPH
jgi:hypothetical protein